MFFAGITTFSGPPPVATTAGPPATSPLPVAHTEEDSQDDRLSGTLKDPLLGHAKFKRLGDLGTGMFGFVQLAQNIKTQEVVAIKFIARFRVDKYVEAEILNHRMLNHFHVVKFKEVMLTRDHVAIVMEYANGGNLSSYLTRTGSVPETVARFFFQQLICALDYCHRRGVVNRDVKLHNMLLQNVEGMPVPLVKICDFGYSKGEWMSQPKSMVGTLAYMAPEVIAVKGPYDGRLADVWSCGVTLYYMLFLQYPFDITSLKRAPSATKGPPSVQTPLTTPEPADRATVRMLKRIMAGQWAVPTHAQVGQKCRDLLAGLLMTDPKQRMTMEQVKAHPWFLTNLPPTALADTDRCVSLGDHSEPGVQSIEAIKAFLVDAKQLSPGRQSC